MADEVSRKCEFCGGPISVLKQANAVYCSKPCSNEASNDDADYRRSVRAYNSRRPAAGHQVACKGEFCWGIGLRDSAEPLCDWCQMIDSDVFAQSLGLGRRKQDSRKLRQPYGYSATPTSPQDAS